MNKTIWKRVTDRMIEQLEEEIVPERRPWNNGTPINLVTKSRTAAFIL